MWCVGGLGGVGDGARGRWEAWYEVSGEARKPGWYELADFSSLGDYTDGMVVKEEP